MRPERSRGTTWSFRIFVSAVVLGPIASQAQRPAPATRDSAGITIVVHDSTVSPRRFTLQPTGVEIGSEPGAELVRVISALRMPSGRILVGDAGRRSILRFSSNGTLERILGRDGRGPGEFVDLRSLSWHGRDSAVAYDGRQFRFAVFTDSGFVRQAVFRKSPHMFLPSMTLVGLRSDGSALVTTGGSIPLGDPGPARIEREEFPVVNYGSDGEPGRLLGRFPGFEIAVSVIEQGPLTGGFSKGRRLFGPGSAFGLVNSHLIVIDNSAFQFDVVDTSGRLIRRVRRQHTPQAVRPAHMSAYAEEQVTAILDPAARAERKATYEGKSHAPVFPALDERVVVDAERRIWLASYKRPGDKQQDWWLFTVDGAMVGRVTVPAALTVTDAGTDYVLGVWRDEDGVQTVRMYRFAQ